MRNQRLPKFLKPDQVAPIFKVGVRTLSRWRARHEGPPFYALGPHGEIYYHVDEVAEWMKQIERKAA